MNIEFDKLPCPTGYKISDKGLYALSEDDQASLIYISSPIWLDMHIKNQNGNYGVEILFLDNITHEQKELTLERGYLFDRGPMLIQRLSNEGAYINSRSKGLLLDFLTQSINCVKTIRFGINQTGWHLSNNGQIVFALPSGKIIGDQYTFFRFQLPKKTNQTKGTLENWQQHVAEPTRQNPFLTHALLFAFSSPISALLNIEGGGFHIYSRSSSGKTTGAQVAASVVGNGSDPARESQSCYIQRWNTTANALEETAVKHHDLPLILDEIHTVSKFELGKIIYDLTGGLGKRRLDSNSTLKKSKSWTTYPYSTGELSSRQHIISSGSQYFSGQQLRLIDIKLPSTGMIQDSKSLSPHDFSNSLKESCAKFYGTALPLFLKKILAKYGDDASSLKKTLTERLNILEEKFVRPEFMQEQNRAAKKFAACLLAGYIASEEEIIPHTQKEIFEAVNTIWISWLSNEEFLPPYAQGLVNLQNHIIKHEAKFYNYSQGKPKPGIIYGYIKNGTYYMTKEHFSEAVKISDHHAVIDYLKRINCLKFDVGRDDTKMNGLPKRPRGYAILDLFLEWEYKPSLGSY